jgi:hypothetical protein
MTKSLRALYCIAPFICAAAISVSCISTNKSLGGSLVPTDQNLNVYTTSMDLPVTMEMTDSIQSSSSSYLAVGSINTPELGTMTVGSAFDLVPETDSMRFEGDPKFVKFYIDAVFSSHKTLDDNQAGIIQNLYFYPLTRILDTTDIYAYSLKPEDYEKKLICKGIPAYDGSGSVEVDMTDWAAKYLSATDEELDSLNLFAENFTGIYMTTDPQESSIYGGRINYLDLSSTYGYLEYERTDSTGARTDTTVAFTLGYRTALNVYKSSSENLVSGSPTKKLYVEGMSGIKPYISAAKLRQTIEDWAEENGLDMSKIIVTRASMVFPFEYDGDYLKLDNNYPSYLYPNQRTTSGGYTYFAPLSEIYDSMNDKGAINRSNLYYKPDVTLYIQDIIHDPADSISSADDIWLVPVSETKSSSSSSSDYSNYYSYYYYYYYGYNTSSSSTTYYTTDYIDYYAATLNGNLSDNGPRLELTYTVMQ